MHQELQEQKEAGASGGRFDVLVSLCNFDFRKLKTNKAGTRQARSFPLFLLTTPPLFEEPGETGPETGPTFIISESYGKTEGSHLNPPSIPPSETIVPLFWSRLKLIFQQNRVAGRERSVLDYEESLLQGLESNWQATAKVHLPKRFCFMVGPMFWRHLLSFLLLVPSFLKRRQQEVRAEGSMFGGRQMRKDMGAKQRQWVARMTLGEQRKICSQGNVQIRDITAIDGTKVEKVSQKGSSQVL